MDQLPVLLVELISSWIDGADVLNLICCSPRMSSLWRHVTTFRIHDYSGPFFLRWPRTLASMPHIEDLELSYTENLAELPVLGVALQCIPTSIRRLKLIFGSTGSAMALLSQQPPSLSDRWPSLTELSFNPDPSRFSRMDALPHSLQELSLISQIPANSVHLLPPYLHTLSLSVSDPQFGACTWPATLTVLKLTAHYTPELIPTLPTSLTHLELINPRMPIMFATDVGEEWDPAVIAQLPSGLTHLCIDIGAKMEEKHAEAFPPALTFLSLKVASIPSREAMIKLVLQLGLKSATTSAVPGSDVVSESVGPWRLLCEFTSVMLTFGIRYQGGPLLSTLENPLSATETYLLHTKGGSVQSPPQHSLVELKARSVSMDLSLANSMPPSLVVLELTGEIHFDARCFAALPNTLTSLSLPLYHGHGMAPLPPALTSLRFLPGDSVPLAPRTAPVILHPEFLPPSLLSFELVYEHFPPESWFITVKSRLLHLTSFSLTPARQFRPDLYPAPATTATPAEDRPSGETSYSASKTYPYLHLLPRTLTSLTGPDISTVHVTRDMLLDLPSSLTVLSLNTVNFGAWTNFTLDDLALLPANLHQIDIPLPSGIGSSQLRSIFRRLCDADHVTAWRNADFDPRT